MRTGTLVHNAQARQVELASECVLSALIRVPPPMPMPAPPPGAPPVPQGVPAPLPPGRACQMLLI